jgi:DNA-binding MarR family transcriptional regulator
MSNGRAKRTRATTIGAPDPGRWDPVERAASHWDANGFGGGPRLLASLSIIRVEDLIRTNNAVVLQPLHLTHARHEALAVLFYSRDGQMKLSELGQRLLLHPTSITSTVDSLEKLGYVQRTPHPTDRRATMATITESGRQAIIATSSVMRDHDYWLDALTVDEAAQLFALLRKVRDAAGDIVPVRHDDAVDALDA